MPEDIKDVLDRSIRVLLARVQREEDPQAAVLWAGAAANLVSATNSIIHIELDAAK